MPSGSIRKPAPISSRAMENCLGTSMTQPRARSRTNSTAISGPPTAITTVLMFCTHCGAICTPKTIGSTLRSKNNCRPLGAIW